MTVAADRLWSRNTWPVVAATLGLMTAIAVESFAVTTVLPVIAAELDATAWYSLAFAATITTGLIGMVIGGRWVDRSGTTVPLTAGGLAFLAGIALCVVAPTMEVFIAGRLLQGLGGGIDSVVVYVVVARHLPEAVRPRMFGLLTAAWLLPSVLGPVAAGAAAELLGWRVVFAGVLVGAAVALAALLRATRGGPAGTGGTGTGTGRRGGWAVVAATAIVALHVGGVGVTAISVAVLPVALVVLIVAATRLLPRGTLRGSAGIPRLVALRGALGATVAVADTYLPLYLQHERGFPPTAAGLVVAVGAVGWASGAWWQGRRKYPALLPAAVLVLTGPVTALAYVAGVVSLPVIVVASVLMGAGMGAAYPAVTSRVLAMSPPREQGTNSSGLQAADSMSSAGFLALTGAVLAVHPAGYVLAYALAVASGLMAVLLGARLRVS